MKKWQLPHFYINPPTPFSGLPPLSSKKFNTPQVTQFLEGPTHPFNKGGSNYAMFTAEILTVANTLSSHAILATSGCRVCIVNSWKAELFEHLIHLESFISQTFQMCFKLPCDFVTVFIFLQLYVLQLIIVAFLFLHWVYEPPNLVNPWLAEGS